MKKKNGSLSTFGIILLSVFGVGMIAYFYYEFPDQPFHMRVLEGVWRFFIAAIGTGFIYLVLLVAMYLAVKLCDGVFNHNEEFSYSDLLKEFDKLSDPFLVICFFISYAIVFFQS